MLTFQKSLISEIFWQNVTFSILVLLGAVSKRYLRIDKSSFDLIHLLGIMRKPLSEKWRGFYLEFKCNIKTHSHAIFSVLWMLPPIFQCPIVFGVSRNFIDEPELEALNFDQSFHLSILSFFPHFLSTRLDCVPSKNVPLAGLPVHPEHLVGGSPQLRVRVSALPRYSLSE